MTHTKQAIKLGLAALNCALIIFIFATMAHGQEQTHVSVPVSVEDSGIAPYYDGAGAVIVIVTHNRTMTTLVCADSDGTTCVMPLAGETGNLRTGGFIGRSEEHTSELQSLRHL